MARLLRIHRVVGVWPDGRKRTRNYLTPEAAEERRARWSGELDTEDESGELPTPAAVTVEPSYPVVFPRLDREPFDIPDSVITRAAWHDLAARVGIKPEAVLSITVEPSQLVVEYDPRPDRPGQHAPKMWRVYIEEKTE